MHANNQKEQTNPGNQPTPLVAACLAFTCYAMYRWKTRRGTIRDRPRFPMPALGREPYVRLPKPTTATGRTADESSHSAAYSLNVGNLRDTGHSDGAMPPAAMADQQPDNQLG
jgi:hypothetical protein